jgi:hypothetical protein
VEAARGGGHPPSDLLLAWWCGDARLPEAGGVLEQDYITMRRMTVLKNVYQVVSRMASLQGARIHTMSQDERRMVRYLRDVGVW